MALAVAVAAQGAWLVSALGRGGDSAQRGQVPGSDTTSVSLAWSEVHFPSTEMSLRTHRNDLQVNSFPEDARPDGIITSSNDLASL